MAATKTAKKVTKKVTAAKTVKKVNKKTSAIKVAKVKKVTSKVAVKTTKPVIKVKETKPVTKKVSPKKAQTIKAVEASQPETTQVKQTTQSSSVVPDFDLQEMFELGCHFGHKSSKWHPKMAEYIYGEKDGIHLFDLPKVAGLLATAYAYVYQLAKDGKTLILVGSKKAAREAIKEAALEAHCFYVNARWMGGMLTNWSQVSKSIKRMEEIREGLETDKYKGYTKYERVQLEKEATRLERFFGGLKGLNSKPDCVFVVDPKKERITVAEANGVGIPVIALIDSDSDPRPIQFVLPGNDDASKSIQFFVQQIAAAYKAGRTARK